MCFGGGGRPAGGCWLCLSYAWSSYNTHDERCGVDAAAAGQTQSGRLRTRWPTARRATRRRSTQTRFRDFARRPTSRPSRLCSTPRWHAGHNAVNTTSPNQVNQQLYPHSILSKLFVDAVKGSDASAGTLQAPFLSIEKVLQRHAAGGGGGNHCGLVSTTQLKPSTLPP